MSTPKAKESIVTITGYIAICDWGEEDGSHAFLNEARDWLVNTPCIEMVRSSILFAERDLKCMEDIADDDDDVDWEKVVETGRVAEVTLVVKEKSGHYNRRRTAELKWNATNKLDDDEYKALTGKERRY